MRRSVKQQSGSYSEPDSALESQSKHFKVTTTSSQSRQLLRIFQSEEFTPDQVIGYFISTFDEPGPHQFLTHKLLTMPDKFVEYYIPQFCYMLAKNGSYSMESFIEELCKRSISTYLKITWCLNAYSEGIQDSTRILNIDRRLEATMINCANKYTNLDVLANQGSVDFHISNTITVKYQEMQKMFLEKEHRLNYVYYVQSFVTNMVKLSLTLKGLDPKNRKPFLRQQIDSGNKLLRSRRQKLKDQFFYWGIMFPFERNKEDQKPSNLIVRIIDTDHACFNTKTRVPYRILIETVSEQEIADKLSTESYDVNQLDGTTTNASDTDEFLKSDESPLILEQKMRFLTEAKMHDEQFLNLRTFHKEQIQQTIISLSKIYQQKKSLNKSKSTDRKTEESRSRRLSEDIQMRKPQKQTGAMLLQAINQEYEKQDFVDQKSDDIVKIHPKFCGPWGEDWDQKFQRIRDKSPFKNFESLQVRAIMVKGGDDLRQELLAMQVIQKAQQIFGQASPPLNLYLKPYEIIVTSENSGILEYVPNTLSLDGLKKMLQNQVTLKQFFLDHFQKDYQRAQMNFIQSLAAYSIITYLLQVKDRHNGNLLIDNQGHIIHIDFGFMLSISPGNMNFESAPFKLTAEYMELMNGEDSQLFDYFRQLMLKGFLEIRKHTQAVVQLVEIMAEKSNLGCFKNFSLESFRQRFQENSTENQCKVVINGIISQSINNSRTVWYDDFQKLTNGISP